MYKEALRTKDRALLLSLLLLLSITITMTMTMTITIMNTINSITSIISIINSTNHCYMGGRPGRTSDRGLCKIIMRNSLGWLRLGWLNIFKLGKFNAF